MIKTARTTIRPFVSSDLNDLQQILGDPVTMTYVEPWYYVNFMDKLNARLTSDFPIEPVKIYIL